MIAAHFIWPLETVCNHLLSNESEANDQWFYRMIYTVKSEIIMQWQRLCQVLITWMRGRGPYGPLDYQCLCLIDDAYLSLRPSRGIPPCSGLCNPVETPRRPPPGWSTIPAPPSSPSRCHCWCLERWRELLEQHVKRSDYYRQSLHFSLDPRASTYFLPWSRTVYSHRCFHCYSHASCCRFPCLVACAEWWCISCKAPGGLLKTTQWNMSESGYTVRCDA